ncbi:hypothetical protein MUK42_04457 [Musa troglodytarum]|uniref:Uncharacterized protein n=1 Tax=Musa troglodytarum TaxID=320322 RepID=A0A9E7KCG2_9LILI|nr:hypothetical protein MUK42_04457 [Musa troglodytarum]
MEVAVRSKVQRLYEACASVFCAGKDDLLTLEQIRRLRSLLGSNLFFDTNLYAWLVALQLINDLVEGVQMAWGRPTSESMDTETKGREQMRGVRRAAVDWFEGMRWSRLPIYTSMSAKISRYAGLPTPNRMHSCS